MMKNDLSAYSKDHQTPNDIIFLDSLRALLLVSLLWLTSLSVDAQRVNSDFWAATDDLGRTVGTYESPGEEKTVIMFYWTWNQNNDKRKGGVKNITEIVRAHPEALQDDHHPCWDKAYGGIYYWDEPLFGYYQSHDKWVLRKHAEMLADAKVDAVMFDCTNGAQIWDMSTDSLLEVWHQARLDGVKVPKIGFILPFWDETYTNKSLRHLYEKYYSKGLYQDLWFYWNGKPCIMAFNDDLTDSPLDQEIKNFFTFRPGQPDYQNGPDEKNDHHWGWLENYPQHGYVKLPDGRFELVTVGVAQNTSALTHGHCSAFNLPNTQGRSFSKRKGWDPRPDGYLYGWNFEEQWDRAYELNPKAVFITGWNEWIAGRWKTQWTNIPFEFVDEFDWDHSRDIEPVKSWGDRGDVYYLQLVDRVRKFKGTGKQEAASAAKTIRMGDWKAWEDVKPVYTDHRGYKHIRHSVGAYGVVYKDNSTRNDIVEARVSRDEKNVYFYVATDEKLTSPNERMWMVLFIDTDRNKETGWNGYDYVVNYRPSKGSKVYVQKCYKKSWRWDDAGEGRMKMADNRLMISIPRQVLGLEGKALDFEFKWNDNMQDEGNIMDFYVSGDTAPGGRFNYVFTE